MNFSKIPMVSQPNIDIKLFPHQLASIHKMEKLERENIIEKSINHIKETKIGINADIAGYGKTLSMIGLIVRDKMDWNLETPYVFETIETEGKGRIKNHFFSRFDRLPTTLILCSHSIICQWEKELQYSSLKVYAIKSNKELERVNARENDVILVTPTHYNRLVFAYEKYAWKRFIFDEPGHLKIANMRPIHCGFFWLVTATPELILPQYKFCKHNFMKDIVSSMYDPDCFIEDLIIKNSMEFIKSSFEMPLVRYLYHKCFQPFYKNINSLVSPQIRTMIEAGNIEEAIVALGGSKTSNIFELIKKKKMDELIDIELKIKLYLEKEDITNLEKYMDKKEKVLSSIDEIESKYNDMLKSDCFICLEQIKSPILEPSCQNLFCGPCLIEWLKCKKTCPFCRKEVNIKDLTVLQKENIKRNEDDENEREIILEQRMTKIEKIIQIIKNNPEGKFLVFSDYDNTFYPICDALKENKIGFVQVKGTIKNREKNLEMFRNGEVPVIFLNSTVDGSGINLTESTDIILCHHMEKSKEQQIVGRALRIGRDIPLNIHYLQITE